MKISVVLVVAAIALTRLPAHAAAAPAAEQTMAPMSGMPMPAPARTPRPATPAPSPSAVTTAAPSPSPAPATESPLPTRSSQPDMPGMSTIARQMQSPIDLADEMAQDGSGTSWQPASSQMFGWMQQSARDMQMLHGTIFPRYVASGSARGARRADAPNWIMLMGSHAASERSQFGYTAMVSADALSENQNGYPLLFQTGESAHGVQLHDAQHPHDLFSALAVTYSTRIGSTSSAYVYAGYPGEPALGPPAFMHRRIAYDMPDSTLGHHWQDATHIQFGVATLGFAANAQFKIETSAFTGREPNEIRTNLDPIHLDSYSGRLSWNPNANVAAQVSFAFIKSPEALEPATDQHRLVASLLYNKPLGRNRNLYIAAIFGQNADSGSGLQTRSYLFESEYQLGRTALYGRVELGTRSARDLAIPILAPDTVVSVGAFTFGAVRDLTQNLAALNVGLGGQITVGSKSANAAAAYGSGTPLGYELFFRIRPPDLANTMHMMDGMKM